MVLKLVVTAGKLAGKEIPVRNNQFVIGRDPSCHLRPSSPAVSKLHCAVIVADEGVWLRDLKSTNGTFLNGQRLNDRALLHHGDKITVGPLTLEVQLPPTKSAVKSLPERAAQPKPEQEVKISSPKPPSKKKADVGDDDVFEWLSEEDDVDPTQADSDANLDVMQQTLVDTGPLQADTIPEVDPPKSTPPAPTSQGGETTSAADRALKGMGMSFRKRA
ncbi:FHA domain-containing protein [bacterium]|jgi:pSer/pThr/pTyr-binding forkhead associated (FHA) protein|nr:FHA domain-containing protein [bacterium]